MKFGIAAAGLLLLAVAIVNGGPIIYPDSMAYVIDGQRFAHMMAPYAVRPVFYGLAIWPLYWGHWFWGALYVQAVIVAHLLWLTLRTLGAGLPTGGFLAVMLGLVIMTPIAWHTAHLLPDIFTAVLVLALFLLGVCADRLGRGEIVYLVLLAAASISFHLAAWPVALALLAVTGLAWVWGDRRLVRPLLVALPIGLALAGSLGFSAAIWNRITLTPNSPPVLLARLLADGPGRQFRRARCPAAGFELCRYQDQLPATEDGFMWEMLPALPVADGKRIKAEAGAVVAGTVAMFPWQVVGHMAFNSARQLVLFRSETQIPPAQWAAFQASDSPLAPATRDTLQSRGLLDRPHLDQINVVHAVIAGLSLVAALALLMRCVRLGAWRPAALLTAVFIGLAANALISGAIAGGFARYGGRVIWLLPFAVIAAALALDATLGSSGAVPLPWRRRTGFRTGSTLR